MRFNTRILLSTQDAIQEAAKLLKDGEVVGLPTETVYGLAANAYNAKAVTEIFHVKERPAFDPLIVHVSDQHLKSPAGVIASLAMAGTIGSQVASWQEKSKLELLIARYWPGPLTLVLPRGSSIPDEVTSGLPTVGIRCPAHPAFQQVLALTQFPLAAPSANRFGRISPTRAQHVYREFAGNIPMVIDGGPCTVGVESTILKVEDAPFRLTVLRPGKISPEEIQKFLNVPVQVQASSSQPQAPQAPGMLDEHYAPSKPLVLTSRPFNQMVPSMITPPAGMTGKAVGILSMGPIPESYWATMKPSRVIELSLRSAPVEIAQRLFLSMRELDEDDQVAWILADVPDLSAGLAVAIRDRLQRASQNKPLK